MEATLQQMEREAIAFAEAVKSDATRESFRRFLQRSGHYQVRACDCFC